MNLRESLELARGVLMGSAMYPVEAESGWRTDWYGGCERDVSGPAPYETVTVGFGEDDDDNTWYLRVGIKGVDRGTTFVYDGNTRKYLGEAAWEQSLPRLVRKFVAEFFPEILEWLEFVN